jgi:hypothetical protein
MPTPTTTDFRTTLPEFQDDARYTDGQIQIFLTIGTGLVSEQRWGNTYAFGVQLVAAHFLTISARNQDAAYLGGTPGEVNGPVSSKAVDKVSISYSDSTNAKDAGQWGTTTYGQQYVSLRRIFGAGPLQV